MSGRLEAVPFKTFSATRTEQLEPGLSRFAKDYYQKPQL
jgi:hypothetical protein